MNEVGAQGIGHLRKLSGLEQLNLQRCRLESDSVALVVGNFPRLKVLQLGYNRLNRAEPLGHL